MEWQQLIEHNPEIMLGKPVIKGTRIPVNLILEKLGHGISKEEILLAYPRLTLNAIHACLLYAAGNDSLLKKDIEEITSNFVHIDNENF
jgi:uncharacterized protein (DUF433 family)